MGVKDTVTKDYMKDPYIFADAFNYLLYHGEPVILPEKLHPLDTTVTGVPYGEEDAAVPVQKFRDNMKYVSGMKDDKAVYLLLGVELQSEIHYAMPVKDMVYDALQYASQVEEAAKTHRRIAKKKSGIQSGKNKKPSSGEYLSGFYKEDRLLPVITLVIYFGPDRWDGPVCLHEMLAVTDKKLLCFVPDYKINLITPEGLNEEQLDRFRTSLREVLLFTKYSKDKEKLYELVKKDERFHRIDRKAGRVISTVTGTRIKMDESEETIDMCKAIQDLQDEAMQTGIQTGMQTGIQIGIQTGMQNGIFELLEEHGTVSDGLRACIQEEKDMEVLKLYLKKASRVQSVEEFEQWVRLERKGTDAVR